MLKLAGALMMILGCSGFGWCICRDMEKHIAGLRLLARAFSMLKSEVGYSRATLPEGMLRVGARLGGELGECFDRVGRQVRGEKGVTFAQAWEQEAGIYLQGTCLGRTEKELILSFPGFTGFVDGQMQLTALEQFGREVEQAEEAEKKQYAGRRKAVLSVSAASGILLAILLI